MRGADRPAAVAAALIFGATWVSIDHAFAIHKIVPSVSSPATRRSRGASAESITRTGCGGVVTTGMSTRKCGPR